MRKGLTMMVCFAILLAGTITIAAAAPVKLTFMTWEPKGMASAIAKFEKDTGYTVEVLADDPNKIMAMGMAGDAVDVFLFHGGGQFLDLASKGFLMPLDAMIAKSKTLSPADILPINNLCRWDGKTEGTGPYYGIIKDYGSPVFFYNKRMFDKAGIAYPSVTKPLTADEFRALAKKLTVYQDGKVVQYGWAEPSADNWVFPDTFNLARAAASNGLVAANFTFTDDYKKLSFDENTPGVVPYVQMLVDMAMNDHSWPSPLDPSTAWAGDLFIHDKAALEVAAPWWVGWCEQSDPQARKWIGFAPTPLLWGKKQIFPNDMPVGFAIMKNAKKEAFQLLEYLQYYGGTDNTKIAWNIPTTKALQKLLPRTDPYWVPYFKEFDRIAPMETFVKPNPYLPDYTGINDAIAGTNLKDLFTGNIAVKDWLKKGVAAANAKIADAIANR
jgi:multiple sugar transport system substrate-binding protein